MKNAAFLVVFAVLAPQACAPQSSFKGAVAAKDAAEPEVINKADDKPKTPKSGTVSETGSTNLPAGGTTTIPKDEPTTLPPKCDANQKTITEVKMIDYSPMPVKRNTGLKVKYQITLRNCSDGAIVPIKDEPIKFDCGCNDGQFLYTATNPLDNAVLGSGTLKKVTGQGDLFGNKGSNYFYSQTEKFSVPIVLKTINFEVTHNLYEAPYAQRGTKLDLYLKIGDSQVALDTIESPR